MCNDTRLEKRGGDTDGNEEKHGKTAEHTEAEGGTEAGATRWRDSERAATGTTWRTTGDVKVVLERKELDMARLRQPLGLGRAIFI